MKQGEKIVFKGRGHFASMTQDKVYTVLDFDPNDGPPWPAGCSGSPLVKVRNDNGGESWWWAWRFSKLENLVQ